jgi:hypothetical protein
MGYIRGERRYKREERREKREERRDKIEFKKKTQKAYPSFDYDTTDIIKKISTR